MDAPTIPSWFKGRQGKAEEVAPNVLKLTGPNLREGYITVREVEPDHWHAALRFAADGPDAVISDVMPASRYNAWEAAFELFRTHVVV